MKTTTLLLVILVFMQVFTTIKLIETRHELRIVSGEVTLHDEMLENVGDAVTALEARP